MNPVKRWWLIRKGQKPHLGCDRCHADRDGDCVWDQCPQLRDNEPVVSGRHCPLDRREELE